MNFQTDYLLTMRQMAIKQIVANLNIRNTTRLSSSTANTLGTPSASRNVSPGIPACKKETLRTRPRQSCGALKRQWLGRRVARAAACKAVERLSGTASELQSVGAAERPSGEASERQAAEQGGVGAVKPPNHCVP